MVYLVNLVFLVLFGLFAAVCIIGWFVFRSLRDAADRLIGGGRHANGGSQRRETRSRASDEEVIIDSRTSDKANRKIFSDDEGEYVDFEEEK